MKIDRALKLRTIFVERINTIYSHAAHWHDAHDQILKCLSLNIWDTPEYKKSPRWLHSYLQGYRDCKADYFRNQYLVFGCLFNGQFYEKWEEYPEALKDIIRNNGYDSEAVKAVQGTFYKGSLDRFD